MANVTLDSREMLINGYTQFLVNTNQLSGNNQVDNFINLNSIMDGDRRTASDKTRGIYTHLEQNSGTTGYVNDAGQGQGVDFNTPTDFADSKGKKREYRTTYTIIERNLGELNQVIDSINIAGDSLTGEAAYARVSRSSLKKIIMDNLVIPHLRFRRQNFYDIINNGQTTSLVWGQLLFALTGSVDLVNNLYTGALSADTVKAVLDKMLTQTDYKGDEVAYTKPYFVLSDATYHSTLKTLLQPRLAVNVNNRTITDTFGFYGAEIAQYNSIAPRTLSDKKITFFSKSHGYKNLIEANNGSTAPIAQVYIDGTTGTRMYALTTIEKQIVSHRQGMLQLQLT